MSVSSPARVVPPVPLRRSESGGTSQAHSGEPGDGRQARHDGGRMRRACSGSPSGRMRCDEQEALIVGSMSADGCTSIANRVLRAIRHPDDGPRARDPKWPIVYSEVDRTAAPMLGWRALLPKGTYWVENLALAHKMDGVSK
eukprot:CAMPEP_0113696932 /NCGR_PEP_ID=MMETSP0038_2-20120614/21825_1 /TAXON_ID=2898 /ORGANISM="Cryptomonas paramecium" /LENGTH=141 /DNA_ID=CAMNT_0000619831 /DNA_START=344 /DNA_END=770 /DNA_ORIENTATION=+ /assembly_acc=CAM_ASM_000170